MALAVRYPNCDGSALNAMEDAAVRWYSLCHNLMPLLRPWSDHHCARGLIQSLSSVSGRCRFEVGYKMLVTRLLQYRTFTQASLQLSDIQSADIILRKARSSLAYARQEHPIHVPRLCRLRLRYPRRHRPTLPCL
jgi:hypothetical protein